MREATSTPFDCLWQCHCATRVPPPCDDIDARRMPVPRGRWKSFRTTRFLRKPSNEAPIPGRLSTASQIQASRPSGPVREPFETRKTFWGTAILDSPDWRIKVEACTLGGYVRNSPRRDLMHAPAWRRGRGLRQPLLVRARGELDVRTGVRATRDAGSRWAFLREVGPPTSAVKVLPYARLAGSDGTKRELFRRQEAARMCGDGRCDERGVRRPRRRQGGSARP
jgi:hypothetical protein